MIKITCRGEDVALTASVSWLTAITRFSKIFLLTLIIVILRIIFINFGDDGKGKSIIVEKNLNRAASLADVRGWPFYLALLDQEDVDIF